MLSQMRSTSSSRCDESTTSMLYSALIWRINANISSRWTGSRPSVGSSRSTRLGSAAIAWQSFTR